LGAASAEVEDSISRLVADSGGKAKISLHRATGVARFVRLPTNAEGAATKMAPEAKTQLFFEQYGGAFGIENVALELKFVGTFGDAHRTHLIYRQTFLGVEVFGGELRSHLDSSGRLTVVNGTFVPNVKVDVQPAWSEDAAAKVALRTIGQQKAISEGSLEVVGQRLYVYRKGLLQGIPGQDLLVWEIEVADSGLSIRERVYVDAHFGKVVNQINMIHDALARQVSEGSLANVVWTEGNPDPIPPGWAGGSAQQVSDWQDEIDGSQESYNLFASMTNGAYLSYDGADAVMRTVNNDPSISCPNANWNGVSANYCTGVTADDVVAHEWGHAYTEFTNNLIYQWQSGALNESYSDIWGETVDQINGRGTDTPGGPRSDGSCSIFGNGAPSVDNTYRWLMGEDASAFGGALRDMWRPVCHGDPGKVTDTAQYICTTFDNGGVHINSGIPNHAYTLMVDGGTYNGQTVNGIGLTKAARIHWEAQNMLNAASAFPEHADALDAACAGLIGATLYDLDTTSPVGTVSTQVINAGDCTEVSAAITAVEFRTIPTFCGFTSLLDPNAPALCPGSTVQNFLFEDWENGLGSWTVGTRAVVNPMTFDTADWAVVSPLPDGRAGSAAFVADTYSLGDCITDIEAGALFLDSPVVAVPATAASVLVAFDHWVATESTWDGGNVKVSVNGGGFSLVPSTAYTFNAYNDTLVSAGAGNDNPLAGEDAFTGTDGGSNDGTWGQSQVDLAGIASPGDTVQLRFEMGLDGCNGLIGWYVDEVRLHSCVAACTLRNGPAGGKFNLPLVGGSTQSISGILESPPGTQVYYFSAVGTDTGGGGTLVGTLEAGGVILYDVRGTYTITNPTVARGTLYARIFPVGSIVSVGKIDARWADRLSINLIGAFRGEWKICD
jgi:Zn-dependent metalloprotease